MLLQFAIGTLLQNDRLITNYDRTGVIIHDNCYYDRVDAVVFQQFL